MAGLKEKNRSRMKNPQNHFELAVDILCLAASYGLLFLMPQKVNFLFWALFAVSAFLFCIGFFRMGFLLDDHKTALLLIEAIVMYSITASHADAPRSQWITIRAINQGISDIIYGNL